jgi:hypothetical protein
LLELVQVQQAARTELRRLVKGGASPAHRAACRTIYESATFDASGNETARVLPSLPIQLYLADDRLALVLLALDSAVILQPCGLLDARSLQSCGTWARVRASKLVHRPRSASSV